MDYKERAERITEILQEIDDLAKIIRSDQKKGKYLKQTYHNRLETIREMIGEVRPKRTDKS